MYGDMLFQANTAISSCVLAIRQAVLFCDAFAACDKHRKTCSWCDKVFATAGIMSAVFFEFSQKKFFKRAQKLA
jgi:hypothetical protein